MIGSFKTRFFILVLVISASFLIVGAAPHQTKSAEISKFSPPLARANERVTKKPFGLYVTLKNSPVLPERFTGYHTGADFEIFADEKNKPVQVTAVCAGKLIAKQRVTGYGFKASALQNPPIPLAGQ
ncbi:MAG: hypothetical protein A3H70_05580 [Candidatus Komeilibacteria bacterium RIFCSPLOWO2_02_FULL_48_11]|uniref:Peptidase M23 domain-containing protein n=1 Tax=Candidatus Komeilibacteria bacterium RIFCSPLOWO2_02_FULL_48_11 TaxID=1798553 RepID=A0A1G2BV85_9BACT|nr:MAG: hypothetical protein A3H70_05580 [Candidatus Komeilibacteria bacterium RIFCSPLOWO2_02_FULL_48_11]